LLSSALLSAVIVDGVLPAPATLILSISFSGRNGGHRAACELAGDGAISTLSVWIGKRWEWKNADTMGFPHPASPLFPSSLSKSTIMIIHHIPDHASARSIAALQLMAVPKARTSAVHNYDIQNYDLNTYD
jgi:hypothetical protein